MKKFCEDVLAFLQDNYGDGYGFCVELTEDLDHGTEAVLYCRFTPQYKIKVSADYMEHLFSLYKSKVYIEERDQFLWQKELVDIIEGS